MIVRILNRLFVGDKQFTQQALDQLQINYVLNVGHTPLVEDSARITLRDGKSNEWETIMLVVNLLTDHITSGDICLVRCDGGLSRSPFIIALFLTKMGMSFSQALNYVKRKHLATNIHPALLGLANRNTMF